MFREKSHFEKESILAILLCCFSAQVKFKSNSDVRTLNLYEDLPNFHSENKQSLGELLRGFLHYYTKKFNFSTSCISVRQGGCISREAAASLRSSKNTRTQWKYICIEGKHQPRQLAQLELLG